MNKYVKLSRVVGKYGSIDCVEKQVDEYRAEFYAYDKALLENKNIILDYGDYKNVPEGRFVIRHKNIDFDCLFKRDEESEVLYVVFSGSRPAGQTEPTFKRWSYYKYMSGSMLNIDDPMYKIHRRLVLGWYYGSESECYCDYISEVIEEFARQNNMNKIIFYASSGGGYAALYCACKIRGSMAVVINPQIKLNLYSYAKEFTEITKLDLNGNDSFRRNHLAEMIKEATGSRFLLIENSASSEDMCQLNDLCLTLNAEFCYGLTRLAPHILCWVYEAKLDAPHNAQEYMPMFFAIENLINHFDNADEYSDMYLILSELWNDHYNLVYEMQKYMS